MSPPPRAQGDRRPVRSKDGQRRWWTEGGGIEWIDNDESLENVVHYVNELQ